MKTQFSVAAVLILSLASSACVIKGGSKEYINPPTLGAELLDLKRAYDRGAIEEHQYHAKREELLAASESINRVR